MDKGGRSWIPAKPGGSQLIFTDKPDMVNCLDSEQLGEASWEELSRLSTRNMPNFHLWGTGMMGFTDLLELANVGSNSDPLKPDPFLSSRDEDSTPSRFLFDLNSIPKANAEAVSTNISSKFVPLTPEQSNNQQASKTQILNNEVANERIEVIEIDDDDSDGDYSRNKDQTQTQLQDNQNPDTGTDMSKTPQQQKPRRRKHRPKVVREGGKPARPRKPSVPKTVSPKELGPTGKRKYVRKKPIETPQANTPSEQVNVESMEPKIAESSKRSCRRSLNFDINNNEVRDESSSYKPPSTFGIESHTENFVGRDQSSQVGTTHVKERVMNTNDSTCSSSVCLNNTEQAKRLNRINSSTAMNAFGSHYNSLQAFEAAFLSNGCRLAGMNFPAIHMEKRTEKFYSASTSSSTSTVTAVQNQVEVNLAAASGVEDNHRAPQCTLAVSQGDNNLKKKRSKGPTMVGDFDSLFGTSLPAGTYQPYACIETSAADTRARLATKKHTKRNPHVNCMPLTVYNHYQRIKKPRGRPRSIKKRVVNSVEALLEQFSHLNISAEQYQNALVPYKKDKKRHHYNDKNALVLYQRDGTVVPFDGEFNPLKKRKPRPRVNLDDETSRVWKLLLQDINSVGIDGTDEEKAKWWDEERSVFRGRAESFIARMHLVQGDRRFSKWKGSVVDSCVGVFLTQNVSDHLSSSAFMALAARYPVKSKTSDNRSNEETTRFAQQPEFHVTEPEETIEWRADKPDQPACHSMTIIDAEEVINSNESFVSTSDRDISKKSVDVSAKEKETMKIEDDREQDDMISSQDSVVSSQNSVDSSLIAQNVSCSQSSSETEPAVAFKSNVSSGPTSFLELLRMAQRAINDDSNNEPSEWKLSLENPQEQDVSPTTAGHLHLESNITDFESCDDKRNEDICVVSEHSGVSSESPKTSRTIAEAPKGSVPNQIQERRISQTDPRVSNFGGEILDVTESTNIVDNSKCEPLAVESKSKSGRVAKEKSDVEDWDILRKVAQETHGVRERDPNTMDSVDWETIRCADVNEIAYTIRERGMNNMLAERIKDFLNRLVREHGSADLEWLRDVPPDKAKQYLLSFRGLGLKSVECVRLLTLHHLAFPVDTNVGRIAVRLGWVPLQPLPESLQLHLLEMYPILESIQKFLWPRLCKLDQPTLYELHYQLITFGKVFCTKSKPNCNACPMRGECRHFASAFASARLALPAPEEKSIVPATENIRAANEAEVGPINRLQLPAPQPDHQLVQPVVNNTCGPIIEEPASPVPIIEVPSSPEPEKTQIAELDIEDFDEIPTIKLNIQQFTQNLQNYMQQVQDGDMSKALVALTQDAASLPTPKLKNVSRLRTEHQVYELPDSHPLLEGLDRREPDDPCSYLLAIWTPGETSDSVQPPEGGCNPQETGILCEEKTCFSCNNIRESNNQTVRGTLLIPCRTAMRGSFPLNGTYFQVNEVFADHDSSLNPVDVPRSWIWNLPRRTVYFGTSIPAIFKGLTTEGIQFCFWKGFVCVRGFEQKTRSPRPLMARLHFPASKMVRTKGKPNDS